MSGATPVFSDCAAAFFAIGRDAYARFFRGRWSGRLRNACFLMNPAASIGLYFSAANLSSLSGLFRLNNTWTCPLRLNLDNFFDEFGGRRLLLGLRRRSFWKNACFLMNPTTSVGLYFSAANLSSLRTLFALNDAWARI
jgi:hypothetical protein